MSPKLKLVENETIKVLNPKDLRFCLLPSANPPASVLELHNKAFALWQSVWSAVFDQLKFDKGHMLDDFIRQDFIAVIFHKDVPAAIHLYSLFGIESDVSRAHSYLNGNFNDEFFKKLTDRHVRTIMSMEYMTVNPEYRKGKCDVHLGQVLVGLAVETMLHFGADAAIAPARRDHKVHELAYAFGGEPVVSNVMNHNVPCDLLMCHRDKMKPHDDPQIRNLIEVLWKKREYYPAIEELVGVNNVSALKTKRVA